MNVLVVRIIRRGKYHTRVETSDKRQLLLDNGPVLPYVGQELDLRSSGESGGELRPLRPGDEYPGLIDSMF
jgi:hypothetical protein